MTMDREVFSLLFTGTQFTLKMKCKQSFHWSEGKTNLPVKGDIRNASKLSVVIHLSVRDKLRNVGKKLGIKDC